MSLFEYAFRLYLEAGFSKTTAFDMAIKLIDNLNEARK